MLNKNNALCNAALIQTTSSNDIKANIAAIEPMVRQAVADGAEFVALPENAFFMRSADTDTLPGYGMDDHPGLLAAQKWAKELNVWLLAGSVGISSPSRGEVRRGADIPEKSGSSQGSPHPNPPPNGEGKIYNRSVLINPQGNIAAHYDKIHLFDVEVGDGQKYEESARILPGDKAVVAHTPWGHMGLTICYDLRFPQLFRALAKADASIITVPSAFTVPTGEAHWHVLLRARAIENSCFIVAPAQAGVHAGGRKTYGHSLIVDPWGKILAERAENTPGVLMATLDLSEVEKVRKNLPSLKHDREFRHPATK